MPHTFMYTIVFLPINKRMHLIILFTRANLTHRAYRHEWFHALESSQCVSAEEVFICKFMYTHMHIQVIV